MRRHVIYRLLVIIITTLIIHSCTNDEPIALPQNSTSDIIDNPIVVSDSRVQVLSDWTALWLELDRHAYGMRPTSTARALAYIHLAGYETAVNDLTGYRSNVESLDELEIDNSNKPANLNLEIALNSCYATVMTHFMYGTETSTFIKIEQLLEAKQAELSANLSSEIINNSADWGTYVAQQVIAYSQTDIEAENQILNPQPYEYEPPVGEGYWTYSADPERAWFPFWESVRTFIIAPEETTTVPPTIAYSTAPESAFYQEMMDVYTSSTTAALEGNDDLWIAEFWSDDVEGMMMSPPGRQYSIANQLIGQYDLNFEQSLEFLLKLGFSLNDAAVSTWADKYEYMVMRPSVYIQEHIDPDFQTNLYRFIFWPNPSFPGYPSGHSAFSSAAAGIFVQQFGNTINFTDRSHEGRTEFRGLPRNYTSFTEMAEENGYSRIPLGVHIEMDCTEGLRLGYEVAQAVNAYSLLE